MRIWSIHPKYLDTKGLLALWRETLLARKVLEGRTKGYVHHPQLSRFRDSEDPLACINLYLKEVYEQSLERAYSFDGNKIRTNTGFCPGLSVTTGQIRFERAHLLAKLSARDPERHAWLSDLDLVEPHPLFTIREGPVEPWEMGRTPEFN
jgi:hypothetical protein